jgi:hypothetical protein
MLFPQAELWILLILLGIVKLTWFAARRTNLQFSNPVVPQKTGRVGHWLELLHLGHRAQRLFIKPFRFLAVDIIAEKEQEDREAVFSKLHRQILPLRPHLQSYLNTGQTKAKTRTAVANNEADLLRPQTDIDPEIEEIIQELEILLEIPHDR